MDTKQLSTEAITWCIDNCAAYVYHDEAKQEMREIVGYIDALESDAKLTESLAVRPLRERVKELEAALDSILGMFQYQDGYGMRLYYATDGTEIREKILKEARTLLAKGKTS